MRLVQVEWADTTTHSAWACSKDVVKSTGVTHCSSVGWLIHKDKERILLTSMVGGYGDTSCHQSIPRGCVKEIITLVKRKP